MVLDKAHTDAELEVAAERAKEEQKKKVLAEYTAPEGYAVKGIVETESGYTIELKPDPTYLESYGFYKDVSTGEYVGKYLPPAFVGLGEKLGASIGQGSEHYLTNDNKKVTEFRFNLETGEVKAKIEAIKQEGINAKDFEYSPLDPLFGKSSFLDVSGAGGIGVDPEFVDRKASNIRQTPTSVHLLKLSDSILPDKDVVLRGSFADVSGAGGIGVDPEIIGETKVTKSDIAKGGANFLAGLTAWGESVFGVETPGAFGEISEKYPGYGAGLLLPDIIGGATVLDFGLTVGGAVKNARATKLAIKSKNLAYENALKDADPLTKLSIDESLNLRPTTSAERRYSLAAYSDPLSTANEDRLLFLGNDVGSKTKVANFGSKIDEPKNTIRLGGEFFGDDAFHVSLSLDDGQKSSSIVRGTKTMRSFESADSFDNIISGKALNYSDDAKATRSATSVHGGNEASGKGASLGLDFDLRNAVDEDVTFIYQSELQRVRKDIFKPTGAKLFSTAEIGLLPSSLGGLKTLTLTKQVQEPSLDYGLQIGTSVEGKTFQVPKLLEDRLINTKTDIGEDIAPVVITHDIVNTFEGPKTRTTPIHTATQITKGIPGFPWSRAKIDFGFGLPKGGGLLFWSAPRKKNGWGAITKKDKLSMKRMLKLGGLEA